MNKESIFEMYKRFVSLNEWAAYRKQPELFENTVKEFTYLNIYESFAHYFNENLYEGFDGLMGETDIDRDNELTNSLEFEKFVEEYETVINFGNVTFEKLLLTTQAFC